ncbi:hypothetical protein [Aquisphaera insulae]|uniref:hypothetical protein n=1 Tax=Aquisphaera insulae TaxID=2712864 RepID=UPI0013EBE8EF|nr:hypothetical protein [Aquisphaera insulae]
MNTITDFFRETTEPTHPRLREWKRRLGKHDTSATLEVFRPDRGLSETRPEMNVQFYDDGRPAQLDTVPWDDDLNEQLIKMGVRSVSPAKESERFSLGLRAATKNPQREFGDGYFNAVLLDLLRQAQLDKYTEIAEVMRHTHANEPHKDDRPFSSYSICRELINGAIRGRAKELTDDLKYDQAQAEKILIWAIARYLDDRFSVSNRRRFGML